METLSKKEEGVLFYRNLLELMFNAHSEHVSAKSYLERHGSKFFTDGICQIIIDQLDIKRLERMFTGGRKAKQYEPFLKYLPQGAKLMFSQNLDIFRQAISQIKTKGVYYDIITGIQQLNDDEELRELINSKEPERKELVPTIALEEALKNQPENIEKHCATEISPMTYQNEKPLEITEERQRYLSDSSQQLLKGKNTRKPLKANDPKFKGRTKAILKTHQERRRENVKNELRRCNKNEEEVKDFCLDTEENESNSDEMENEDKNVELEELNKDETMNQDVENENNVASEMYSSTLKRLEECTTENLGLKTENMSLKTEITRLITEKTNLTTENVNLKTEKELIAQQQTLSKIQLEMITNKQLEEKQHELDCQKKQYAELERQMTDLKSLREIEDRVRDEKFEKMQITHNEQIKELENEIENKTKSQENLEEAVAKLQDSERQLQFKIEKDKNTHDKMEHSIKLDLIKYENECDSKDRIIKKLTENEKKLSKEIETLKKEFETYKESEEKYSKEKQELDKKITSLEKELKAYEESEEKYSKGKENLNENITLLKKEIKSHEESGEKYSKEKEELHREIVTLKDELALTNKRKQSEIIAAEEIKILQEKAEAANIAFETIKNARPNMDELIKKLCEFLTNILEPLLITKEMFMKWMENEKIQEDPGITKTFYEEINSSEKSLDLNLKELKKQLTIERLQYHRDLEKMILEHGDRQELINTLKQQQENVSKMFQNHLDALKNIQNSFALQNSLNKLQGQLHTRNELLQMIITMREKEEERQSEGERKIFTVPEIPEFENISKMKSAVTNSKILEPPCDLTPSDVSKAVSLILTSENQENIFQQLVKKDTEIKTLKNFIKTLPQATNVLGERDATTHINAMLTSQAEVDHINDITKALVLENKSLKVALHTAQASTSLSHAKAVIENITYKELCESFEEELKLNKTGFTYVIDLLKAEWRTARQSIAEFYQAYQLEMNRLQAELRNAQLNAEVENMELGGDEIVEMSQQIIELNTQLQLLKHQSETYRLTLEGKCNELDELKRSIIRRQQQYDALAIKRTYMSGKAIEKTVIVALPNAESDGRFFSNNNRYFFNEGELKRKPFPIKKDKRGNIDISEFLPPPCSPPNLILREDIGKSKHSRIVFMTLKERSEPLLYDYATHAHLMKGEETLIDVKRILHQTAAFVKIKRESKILMLQNFLSTNQFKYIGGVTTLLCMNNIPSTKVKIRVLYFFVRETLGKTRFPVVAYSIFTMVLSLFYDLRYDKEFDANVISLFPQSSIDSNAVRTYEDKHRIFFKINMNVFKFSFDTVRELLEETGNGLQGRHRIFVR